MKKLISIDLKANFGFFRKPDTNVGINLSYNMLHKPVLLGILGAIIGLDGYKNLREMPDYYQKLEGIKIGIEPLDHEKGNFTKTNIKYSNTIGYANKNATYLTEEATLVCPAYRCYLLLEVDNNEYHQKIYHYLQSSKAEYLPYFGKNEFYVSWVNENNTFQEYEFEEDKKPENSFSIKTLFHKKDEIIKTKTEEPLFDYLSYNKKDIYLYFENLPLGFDTVLFQYKLGNFVFSTFNLVKEATIDNLYFLKNQNYYVQLL